MNNPVPCKKIIERFVQVSCLYLHRCEPTCEHAHGHTHPHTCTQPVTKVTSHTLSYKVIKPFCEVTTYDYTRTCTTTSDNTSLRTSASTTIPASTSNNEIQLWWKRNLESTHSTQSVSLSVSSYNVLICLSGT